MTEETGITSPMTHIGRGKVAAISFIMICWRTSVMPGPAHDQEEKHGRADIDRDRDMAEKAPRHGQEDDDARRFDGAEAGGKAEEDHPDEQETNRLLGPWQRPPERRPATCISTMTRIPPQAAPAAHVGDQFDDAAKWKLR